MVSFDAATVNVRTHEAIEAALCLVSVDARPGQLQARLDARPRQGSPVTRTPGHWLWQGESCDARPHEATPTIHAGREGSARQAKATRAGPTLTCCDARARHVEIRRRATLTVATEGLDTAGQGRLAKHLSAKTLQALDSFQQKLSKHSTLEQSCALLM